MTRLKLCLAVLLLGATSASADIRQLALTANDLVYDPVTHEIYASTPSSVGAGGNSIVSLDPVSGKIDAPVFIGSEPGELALSGDGQSLYVALNGAAGVRRFDTASRMAGPQFALGADSFFGPYYVEDMAVMPGNPEVVAISRMNLGVSPRHAGVAIYDHGVARGKMTQRHTGSNVIQFSDSPDRLYGYNNETTEFGFRRLTVDASGVTEEDVTDQLISGFGVDIRYDGGLIFSTSGREIDPEARKLLGTFNGLGAHTLVAPDVKAGRVYFLVGNDSAAAGTTWKLLIFDPKTFLQIDSRDIPGVMGAAHSLIRWGQERDDGGGLAFATDQGQVFLISPSPLSTPPPDFSLTLSPTSLSGDGRVTATITLTARAPGTPGAGGIPVALSSSSPAAAMVPAELVVPAGALTASAPVTVHAVPAATDVVITASAGGVTRTATLHLTPPPPPQAIPAAQLLLYPNPVPGGLLALGQVTLPQPAGASGVTIPLSSSSPTAIVPAAVFVPAGASTVTFPIVTFPVTALTPVTITASGPAGPAAAVLQLLPPGMPAPALVPTPPAAPTDLAATTVSTSQVTLTWKDNSDDETAFAVYRESSNGTWARIAVVPPNTTTYTDTDVVPGMFYTYRVQAINGAGASAWSSEITVTTLSLLPAPANLSARIPAPGQVQLSWTDNSRDEDAFAIWRKGGGRDWARIGLVPPNSTAFVDRNAAPGTTYTYRVRATRGSTASDWSNEVSVTVPAGV